MANMKVEHVGVAPRRDQRRDLPLWVLPLSPLVLGALALGLSLRSNDRASTNQNMLTDMRVIVNDPNQAAYAGRDATFANVTVQSVVSDRGFWVGPNTNEQLFVVRDDSTTGSTNDQIQVTPGQRVTLGGDIEKLPPLDQAPASWGLNTSNRAALQNQQVYLHATKVTSGF
jgi:hypothetical protein